MRGPYKKKKGVESSGKTISDAIAMFENMNNESSYDMPMSPSGDIFNSETKFVIKSEPPDEAVPSNMLSEMMDQTDETSDTDEQNFPYTDHLYALLRNSRKSTRGGHAPFSNDSRLMPDTRTSGRKYAVADTEFGEITTEAYDERSLNLVMQVYMSKVTPNHLIIPMVRVSRAALMAEKRTGQNEEPPRGKILFHSCVDSVTDFHPRLTVQKSVVNE